MPAEEQVLAVTGDVGTCDPLRRQWLATAKGRGAVRQRARGAAPSTSSNVLRITRISAEDQAHGAREDDPKPRYQPSMCEGWLPAHDMLSPIESCQALLAMRRGRAVLLRRTPLVSNLAARWNLRYLATAMDRRRVFRVLCSDAMRQSFMECDQAKNDPSSCYHVREPDTRVLDMTFPEFENCVGQWSRRRLCLQGRLMRLAASPNSSDGTVSSRAEDGISAVVQADLVGFIDWKWLQALRRAQRMGQVSGIRLEVACANALMPAQYQQTDRLLAQLWGRCRVLLLGPDQAFAGLAPYPVHHAYDGYAMVDLEQPDLQMWPDAADLAGRCVILGPGDILFVPRFWYVHAQHLDEHNGGLTFDMQPGTRLRAADSIPLQVSRLLEQRVAQAEGVRNVRHWLELIGEDRDAEWTDLDTVAGYRRTVMCESVRSEIRHNMGGIDGGMGSELLLSICKGRLQPTTWLEKFYREPLLIKDVPLRLSDTRSKEERQYPEFFRVKLKAEGWKVPDAEATVPIPGYNI